MRRCSSTARRFLAQPVRWNSTSEALQKPREVYMDPPAPTESTQKPLETSAAPPNPTEPAKKHEDFRRFPKLRVDDGTLYTPNMEAIAATASPNTLSARLAAARASAPPPTTPVAQTVSNEPRPFPTNRTLSQVQLEQITLARRAERQAREVASPPPSTSSAALEAASQPQSTSSATGIDEGVLRRREAIAARRAERLAREAQAGVNASKSPQTRAPSIGQSTNHMASGIGRGAGGQNRGEFVPAGLRSRMNVQGGARGGRGRGRGRGGGGVGGSRRRRRDDGVQDDEDEFMKEIEDWLDDGQVHLASHLTPELPTSNIYKEMWPRLAHSKSLPTRATLENVGGDYSRFVPKNPQLFIASARKIGPINHSRVILSHAKQEVETRLLAKQVVEAVAAKGP
ncbi:hypothetical protein R3P38DRAFT_2821431 [Favolaschia claudopus]|uniref:Uncharacterized protein n=1 Tax=Favolaschia claudopus TaxID=2862362 RepID=A0AAW0EHW0_9AGAR